MPARCALLGLPEIRLAKVTLVIATAGTFLASLWILGTERPVMIREVEIIGRLTDVVKESGPDGLTPTLGYDAEGRPETLTAPTGTTTWTYGRHPAW